MAGRRKPTAVETWPIGRLAPYAKNPRTHPLAQVRQIAASIKEFGWTVPVLATPKGEVVAGHGRLEAAKLLGLDEVPVLVLDRLTAKQRAAYRIADNKLTELGSWDSKLLADEVKALDGLDLSVLGFTDGDLERMLQQPPAAAEDAPASPQIAARCKPGDLWLLGQHRLQCGDATKKDDVARLLDGAMPHLMVTDPPYGVEHDAAWRNRRLGGSRQRVGKFQHDDCADWSGAWQWWRGAVAYVWQGDRTQAAATLEKAGLEVRNILVWVKDHFAIGKGHYHHQHELCLYAVRKGHRAHWQGDRTQPTVWQVKRLTAGTVEQGDTVTTHGTQKPVEVMRRPLLNSSAKGEAVYDPFVGSGTTIIAAETTGRQCYGMELEAAYVDAAIARWEALTGKQAVKV